jgi:hypothetical protein
MTSLCLSPRYCIRVQEYEGYLRKSCRSSKMSVFYDNFSNYFYCYEGNKITKLVKKCNFHILHCYRVGNHNNTILMCLKSTVSQIKLITWNRVLSEKLKGPQLVKKFYTSCGTRIFTTAFANAHHLSLSWYKGSAEVQALVKCFVRS